jgi:acyl carrier protein
VRPEARLVEDLELDSLDAFDLAVKVEEITGVAFDENQIRALRTVEDVIVALEAIARTRGAPAPGSSALAQNDP